MSTVQSRTWSPAELGYGDRVHDGGPDGPVRTVAGARWDPLSGMWAVSFAGVVAPRFCTARTRFWPAP